MTRNLMIFISLFWCYSLLTYSSDIAELVRLWSENLEQICQKGIFAPFDRETHTNTCSKSPNSATLGLTFLRAKIQYGRRWL